MVCLLLLCELGLFRSLGIFLKLRLELLVANQMRGPTTQYGPCHPRITNHSGVASSAANVSGCVVRVQSTKAKNAKTTHTITTPPAF